MRTRWVLIVLWTVLLGVPFTALALAMVALIDRAATVLASISPAVWQDVVLEGSARWPELAGMIIGQALIMLILLLARRPGSVADRA
jgi:hypothetical protein